MKTLRSILCFLVILALAVSMAVPVCAESASDDTASDDTASVPQREYPQYFQGDYPDVRYGNGTIATSGCGIVSLAMVATYMTGHTYTPDELADYFGGYNASNVDRMLNAATKLKLPWHLAYNWHEVRKALEKGCPVIVLENANSKFTQGQHFLVLTGMTEDGRVMAMDSSRANYEKWDLKDGFENGFLPEEICAGYSGAWIFDIHLMPEEPFIYEEPPRPYVEPRYPNIELTLEEEDLLAKVVWVESRGESDKGQQAVAEVVLNRMLSEDFPDDLESVIYAEDQFRSVPFLEDAEPTQTQYEAIENALLGPYVLDEDVFYFARTKTNPNVWGKIGGHIFCRQWPINNSAAEDTSDMADADAVPDTIDESDVLVVSDSPA